MCDVWWCVASREKCSRQKLAVEELSKLIEQYKKEGSHSKLMDAELKRAEAAKQFLKNNHRVRMISENKDQSELALNGSSGDHSLVVAERSAKATIDKEDERVTTRKSCVASSDLREK
jgi:hypothetical protein